MEVCLRHLRAKGAPARGASDFKLIIREQIGPPQIVSLEPLFASALEHERDDAAVRLASNLYAAREARLTEARSFVEQRVSFLRVSGDEAVPTLTRLISELPRTGRHPCLLGPDLSKASLGRAMMQTDRQFRDTQQAAAELDLAAWFDEQRRELTSDGWLGPETIGVWPEDAPAPGAIGAHRASRGNAVRKSVDLAVFQCEEPWQLPALVQYGGWNLAPEPAVQTALFRRWWDVNRARIVSLSSDVLECHVERPPVDRAGAMALAYEQLFYCPDIVEQGTGTVAALAAALIDSDYWYFWWD